MLAGPSLIQVIIVHNDTEVISDALMALSDLSIDAFINTLCDSQLLPR